MGLFDSIGTVLDRAVPTVLGFAGGGPMGAITAAATVEQQKRNEKRMERLAMNPFEQQSRNIRMGAMPAARPPVQQQSFFGNLGQSIGSFGQGVGQFFEDISPLTNIFGGDFRPQRTNAGAAATITKQAPEETATSGEIMGASLGMAPALFQAGRRFLGSPGGQAALGFGAGAIGAALSGGGDGAPRITRKMKSDVRRIYMMAGMDPNITAQILNNMGTYPRMDFNASLVFFILTKRFRNDGPVVTKAAVRKTRTTLRRMKGVVDMYNSVCKPTTRRAPARRAAPKAVQLIKN
jgi:hypothetical protein